MTDAIDGAPADARTWRARYGFIFQPLHLLPELDAIGNLAFAASPERPS